MHSCVKSVCIGLSIALSLAACSGDGDPAETPVARSFDELAHAVASCAETLRDCQDEDGGADKAQSCRGEFMHCRTDSGKAAEEALVDAIDSCQEHRNNCQADASNDKQGERCAEALRSCIGEAHAQSGDASINATGAPNSNAPTYQCFGQLRECVAAATGPKECAQQARACVILAVGELPADHRPTTQPSDAGPRSDGGAGKSGTGGTQTAAGASGAAGARASAGAGGAAPAPGSAGAGGARAPADAGTPTDDAMRACMAEHDACLMSGEKPMMCERDLRKCMKDEP